MALPEDLYNSYLENEDLLPSLAGKAVAITGTTTGLGLALARCAVAKQASLVLLLNRKSERSEKSEGGLRERCLDGGTEVRTVDCDLMSLESVREAADEVNRAAKAHGGLDVLCLNAGIMAYDDIRTKDGFDVQMQTNQLGHFLLTSLVYPSLKDAAEKRGDARIVPQSSSAREFASSLEEKYFERCDEGTLGGNGGGFMPLLTEVALGRGGPWSRYGQTKLANSAFAMALHHKLASSESKIKSIACEPGYSVTPLQSTPHFSGMMKVLASIMPKQSASDGSLCAAMACFSKEANSGDFYAPEKGMVGKPVKVVAGGERQKTGRFGGTDKATCDPQQHKILWDACEKALGITFVV